MERRAGSLTSIPGISDITAARLIVLIPEPGHSPVAVPRALPDSLPSSGSPDTGKDVASSRGAGTGSERHVRPLVIAALDPRPPAQAASRTLA